MTGTNTGSLPMPVVPGYTVYIPPTGKEHRAGPEAVSITFEEDSLRVQRLTVGYVIDRNEGTNGGYGALFGLLHSMGAPGWLLKAVSSNIELLLSINVALGKLDSDFPVARKE